MGKISPSFRRVNLISNAEIEQYYTYLLNAFKEEFCGTGLREQYIDTRFVSPIFSDAEKHFLVQIVENGFNKKHPYKKGNGFHYEFLHPIELIDFIVNQGYPLSSKFLRWVYKKFDIAWDAGHWIKFAFRSIPPVDLKTIKEEMKFIKKGGVPPTLDFYFRIGGGTERPPELSLSTGIKKTLRQINFGVKSFKLFDPIDYLNYYYQALSEEEYTVTKTHYEIITEKRNLLHKKSTVLIVGNGPSPYDAQIWSMIPEITLIIPADFDERNNEIMKRFSGARNHILTPKINQHVEEFSDYIYYLFEQHTGARFGMFGVPEITAAKTREPIQIDIRQENPLGVSPNTRALQKLRADVVYVPFCPESITENFHRYQKYIKNISNLVDSGKFLYLCSLKEANFYRSGKKKIPAIQVNENIIVEELTKHGFVDFDVRTIITKENKKQRGYKDTIHVWARKK